MLEELWRQLRQDNRTIEERQAVYRRVSTVVDDEWEALKADQTTGGMRAARIAAWDYVGRVLSVYRDTKRLSESPPDSAPSHSALPDALQPAFVEAVGKLEQAVLAKLNA